MAYIKSRKHPVARTALSAATATLMTSLAIAAPARAADNVADTTASTTDTKNLPGVRVEATTASDYKIDKVSSPKFTQPLLDTTQTINVISSQLIQEQGATT